MYRLIHSIRPDIVINVIKFLERHYHHDWLIFDGRILYRIYVNSPITLIVHVEQKLDAYFARDQSVSCCRHKTSLQLITPSVRPESNLQSVILALQTAHMPHMNTNP